MSKADTLLDLQRARSAAARSDRVYVGVDTGVHGAIAVLVPRQGRPLVFDMPTVAVRKGSGRAARNHSEYVIPQIIEIVRELAELDRDLQGPTVVLELAQPQQKNGKYGWRQNGIAFGLWRTVFPCFDIGFYAVNASEWKNEFQLLKQDKNVSRKVALELWPTAPCTLVKEDGRAEAMLLAEYCYRRNTGSLRIRETAGKTLARKRKAKPQAAAMDDGDQSNEYYQEDDN